MTNAKATVSISSDLKKRLDALSTLTSRSKLFLANEAISAYIHLEEDYITGINTAREQFKQGEGIPHEEAMAHIKSYALKTSHTT
jgi:predicted transcriptional regulator